MSGDGAESDESSDSMRSSISCRDTWRPGASRRRRPEEPAAPAVGSASAGCSTDSCTSGPRAGAGGGLPWLRGAQWARMNLSDPGGAGFPVVPVETGQGDQIRLKRNVPQRVHLAQCR